MKTDRCVVVGHGRGLRNWPRMEVGAIGMCAMVRMGDGWKEIAPQAPQVPWRLWQQMTQLTPHCKQWSVVQQYSDILAQ